MVIWAFGEWTTIVRTLVSRCWRRGDAVGLGFGWIKGLLRVADHCEMLSRLRGHHQAAVGLGEMLSVWFFYVDKR